MSVSSICSDDYGSIMSTTSTIVAVGVKGNSKSSRRAVRWALDKLLLQSDRFVLVHVMPPITSIPTPTGKHIPIGQLSNDVVKTYRKDIKSKCDSIFLPYKTMSKTRKMETLVLEDENPAYALLRYISESGCTSLVLGSSSNYFTRKLKLRGVPSTLMSFDTKTCNVFVVSRNKLMTKLANSSSIAETSVGDSMRTLTECGETSSTIGENISSLNLPPSENEQTSDISSEFFRDVFGQGYRYGDSFASTIVEENQEPDNQIPNFRNTQKGSLMVNDHDDMDSLSGAKESSLQAELEELHLELRSTIDMYDRACEDLVHIQKKVQELSSECVEEARKVHTAMKEEEMWRKAATDEQSKRWETMKELEVAKQLLANEVHERQKAELSALTMSSEREKMIDVFFSSDERYRRYTKDEIGVATDFFSEAKKIGEGGYGNVYKCSIDHTPVAVKVLQPDESDNTKKEEFLREVEILSQLRHPNLVLLLGACPEIGCLVYEYMENGSLDERLFCNEGTQPLPWFIRFRIAFEVACGLTFLHDSEPEPIIHRDLKPGNILLDRNFVSKIGDVGLAKFMSSVVPDNVTEYRNSALAGTLSYMDPEYYRTGTIRPKSDVYAFGLIVLQLLTGRRPNGLILTVENAMNNGSFCDILDKSVSDWPLIEAEELAWIALECSRLRCRDRPDLKSEVLPVLEKLSSLASVHLQLGNMSTPSYYFCPILQEVMADPYIAADGFTYEYAAIKAWFERQKVSPVTKLVVPHTMLTPNYTLRSAIQEWKQNTPYVP